MTSALDCCRQSAGLLGANIQADSIDLRTQVQQKMVKNRKGCVPCRLRHPSGPLELACRGQVWPHRNAENQMFARRIRRCSEAERCKRR